jgi:hypothetical protein
MTANHTTLPREINGRILVKAYCIGGCGQELQQWIPRGGAVCCQECRDSANRRVKGWLPTNSID